MSKTRRELRESVDAMLRLVHGGPTVRYVTTSASSAVTQVFDNARSEVDHYWDNSWLYIYSTPAATAPQAEESLVTDWSNMAHRYTLAPGFTASVPAGAYYELRRPFSAFMIHTALNAALEEASLAFPTVAEDDDFVGIEGQREYTLPSRCERLLKVEVLNNEVSASGEATGGSTTSLIDTTKSWTVNELAGQELLLYDGTNAGAVRLITANTATTITFATALTTAIADEKYTVVDISTPATAVQQYDLAIYGTKIYFNSGVSAGKKMRFTYIENYQPLTLDTSTTNCPEWYVTRKTIMNLLAMKPELLPSDAPAAQAIYERLRQETEFYLARHKPVMNHGSYWGRVSAKRTRIY